MKKQTGLPDARVMEALHAVLDRKARRIDLTVDLDDGTYTVVVYRQLDNVVRLEVKKPKTKSN